MRQNFRIPKGFTLIELVITTVIVAILTMSASVIYVNFYNSIRNLKAADIVYNEAWFAMERIVKEIEAGTVDYEEYYNKAVNPDQTGQNYCRYSKEFYSAGPDAKFGTFDDVSTGKITFAQNSPIQQTVSSGPQDELFLINIFGTRRSFIRRVTAADGTQTIGKIALLRLSGKDYGLNHSEGKNCPKDQGEGDKLIDTWICEKEFTCETENETCIVNNINQQDAKVKILDSLDLANSSFIDITPNALDITDLKFYIAPSEDPRKAYTMQEKQIQPFITIKMTARANPKIAAEFTGKTPEITLETTVASRGQKEIVTKCNME